VNGQKTGKDLKEMTVAYFGVLFQYRCEETENMYEDVRIASSSTGVRKVYPSGNKPKVLPLYELSPSVLVRRSRPIAPTINSTRMLGADRFCRGVAVHCWLNT
jgi:hypothetical protein